jgi:hypothetical protein
MFLRAEAATGQIAQAGIQTLVNSVVQSYVNLTVSAGLPIITLGFAAGVMAQLHGTGLTIGASATPNAMLDVRGNAIVTGQITGTGGLVLGAELGSLVPATHLMQINAGAGVDPLMLSGGTGCVQLWKNTTPTKAVSFGLAIPGVAIGDDLDFGTYDGVNWRRGIRLTNGAGNLKIGGTALRATTEGTKHIDVFDGVAPVGTLVNGISIYSAAGEGYMMDAAGNATLQTPHDRDTNEWIFYSKNTRTGKVLRVKMERLMKAIDLKMGGGFIQEYTETIN